MSKRDTIKLVITAKDKWKIINSRKKKHLEISDDEDSELEDIKEAPEAILEQVINDNTKIVTSKNNESGLISGMFTIDEADVLVIKDENGEYFYKGKDIALLLEYGDTKGALQRHVSENYKKSYADMWSGNHATSKIDPKTIFIDDSGLFQLISRSKKPQSELLWKKITKEILPTLFRTGLYNLGLTQNEIERLSKSFYDDNSLSKWKNKNCIYIAYIGYHNGMYLLKFGESYDYPRRELIEHRSDYIMFNVLKIWEVSSSKLAESNLKTDFRGKNMLISCKIKNKKGIIKTKHELIHLNKAGSLDACINTIGLVINETI